MQSKTIFQSAALLAALAVILGAFGSHSFKAILEANRYIDVFETANQYHFYHALGLFFVGILVEKYPSNLLSLAATFFIIGMVLFSGSLYMLALSNIRILGLVTPIGGLFFILGWILVFVSFRKK